jgi:hypothetical protein
LPWFWFFFTVAVLLLSAMDRYHIRHDTVSVRRKLGSVNPRSHIAEKKKAETFQS